MRLQKVIQQTSVQYKSTLVLKEFIITANCIEGTTCTSCTGGEEKIYICKHQIMSLVCGNSHLYVVCKDDYVVVLPYFYFKRVGVQGRLLSLFLGKVGHVLDPLYVKRVFSTL